MSPKRILVTLTPDQHAYVQAEAKREGRTLSGMVRQMVQERMPLWQGRDIVVCDESRPVNVAARYQQASPAIPGLWQRISDELEPHDVPKKGKRGE